VQNKIIYSPNKPTRDLNANNEGERHPGERGLPYEDVSFKASDGVRLHGWLMKQNNSKECPTIVFFHGIDGNMGGRLPFVAKLYEMTKANILMVSYRGYGFSEGSPSEKGIQKDALAITEFIHGRYDIDNNNIFLWGTSFGAAVAIYAAVNSTILVERMNDVKVPYKIEFQGLIIENPFASMDEMIDRKIKISLIRKLVLANNWRNVDTISQVTCPLQVLTGLVDPVVPPEHSQRIYNNAVKAEFKHKQDFVEGAHRNLYQMYSSLYWGTISNFMKKCAK